MVFAKGCIHHHHRKLSRIILISSINISHLLIKSFTNDRKVISSSFTVAPPPEGLGFAPARRTRTRLKISLKKFQQKLNESDHFLCISLHLYFHYPQGLGFKSTKGLSHVQSQSFFNLFV